MGVILEIAKIVLIVAGAVLGLCYLFQSKLIFFPRKIPDQSRALFKEHGVRISSHGCELHGWFVRNRDSVTSATSPLVIYYGGNAEEVSDSLSEAEKIRRASFLFMNYRGYGDSSGRPSEQGILADALTVFDWVVAEHGVEPKDVVLMGRSLGSGVAVHVASRRRVGALILVTPFDSLTSVAKAIYPFLPVERLLRHRFDSLALAPAIDRPMLAIIAGRDEIIPNPNSFNLVNAWGGPAETVVVKGAGHNDISLYNAYFREINRFMDSIF
ncbi:MAG: alpha/beta hydrolase [Desulfobacteraceae bacterium]|nr:alpha/beta hydrolase [Desulfobacteraceae bacterium]